MKNLSLYQLITETENETELKKINNGHAIIFVTLFETEFFGAAQTSSSRLETSSTVQMDEVPGAAASSMVPDGIIPAGWPAAVCAYASIGP